MICRRRKKIPFYMHICCYSAKTIITRLGPLFDDTSPLPPVVIVIYQRYPAILPGSILLTAPIDTLSRSLACRSINHGILGPQRLSSRPPHLTISRRVCAGYRVPPFVSRTVITQHMARQWYTSVLQFRPLSQICCLDLRLMIDPM